MRRNGRGRSRAKSGLYKPAKGDSLPIIIDKYNVEKRPPKQERKVRLYQHYKMQRNKSYRGRAIRPLASFMTMAFTPYTCLFGA